MQESPPLLTTPLLTSLIGTKLSPFLRATSGQKRGFFPFCIVRLFSKSPLEEEGVSK